MLSPLLLGLALLAPLPVPAEESAEPADLNLEQLLEIKVVGASKYAQKQSEAAAAVSVITRDEIKTFGWRTLTAALASLPGIHATYDRQYVYLGARGFGLPGDYTTRILLTIDGNRVNDLVYDGAAAGWDLPLDMDLIERIEFIPGPGGAVYGQNAMFGVVNLVTRTGSGVDGGELAASRQEPQSAGQGRVTWGKRLDNGVEMLLSATGYRADGEDLYFDYGDAGVAGIARDMDGEEDRELFANIAQGPWSWQLALGDRRKDDPTASYFADPLVSGQYERDRYLLTQLQYRQALGDRLEFTGRLFLGRQRYTGKFFYDGTPNPSTGTGDWQGAELKLLSTAFADHKLLAGLEAQNNSRIDQTNDDPTTPEVDTDIRESGYRAGLYLQDEWRLDEGLTATLGLRLDDNNITGSNLSPRAGLIWQAGPDTTLKALFGRAHRAPNSYERDFEDAISLVANPDLEGERIDTLELVADRRFDQNLNLRASVYHWVMRDIITLGEAPGTDLLQYQSGEDVRATGVELSADKTWAWGGRLRGSLAWQDAAYENGDQLANSPRLLGKLLLSAPLPPAGTRLGFELHYCDERRAIDGSDVAAYWLANLNLTAERLARGLDLSLGVYNLFDAAYAHPASDSNWQRAIEQDGRSLRLKLEYRF